MIWKTIWINKKCQYKYFKILTIAFLNDNLFSAFLIAQT